MHDSRMFGVKSQQHQQQQLLLGYCAGGKKLLWRLPCLCLVAAILAFTLGFFTAPFVGSARSAVSVGDPLWQMYYIRHKGSTFKPAVRDGGLQQFQQQEAEEAEIEEEGDFKLQPREADLRFGKQGESVQQRRQGSHEIQGPLDFAAEVVEPALESDKHEEETCDLFTGAWVEDNSPPLYTNENCPIVTQTQNCPGNGRPDSNYLNWRWQPQGCDLPAFDAKAFLEMMRGKTLAFVGDSVARNQYESLLCMLWQVYTPESKGSRKMQRWIFRDYSFTVIRVWSSWLVNVSHEAIDFAPENLTKLHLEDIDQNIIEYMLTFDVMVVSSGHWWPKTTAYILNGSVVGGQGWWDNAHEKQYDAISGYAVAMKTAMKAIVTHPNYKGITILRTYSPDHYEGGAWNTGGSCTGKTQPLTTEQLPQNNYTNIMYEHQMTAYREAERMPGRNPSKLRLLDITRVFEYRADGHPGPYRNNDPNKIVARGPNGEPPPQDCLHWCMPGPIDTWNYFLFEMLQQEFLN
ncbi:hypothetical protein CY35_08G126700 [Sphagnum magellanicum]|nr:hypothetical protein CY35_08G126700 [Sphagnum magellanicum]